MKQREKRGLSEFQLGALVFGAIVGSGIPTLPRQAAEAASRDGWISIAMTGIPIWLLAWLIYLLCRRFPRRTLPEFSTLILGKPLGILVSVLYAAYALILAGINLRIFIDLTKTWVMIWTPVWVILLMSLSLIVYITRMGIITLARVSELIFFMTLSTIVLFFLPLRDFNPLNLRPFGAEGIDAILAGVPGTYFAYLGFEIMLVLFPFVRNRENILKVYATAIILVILVKAGNAFLIYGVLGVEYTLLQTWPLISYLRIATTPVLERVDNLFLFIWLTQITATVAIHYYASTLTLSTLTGKRHRRRWVTYSWIAIFLMVVYSGREITIFAASESLGRWGLFFVLFLVLLLLGVAAVRGFDEREVEPG